jgi:predicted small secreted protein
MKKLLLVLLVVTLASFLLVGCTGTTPAEGEGEGEGEAEAVIIEILDAVEVLGKLYVAPGSSDVTATFSAPVENVYAYLTDCTGDYSKDSNYSETPIVLWPNADKTVWSGSINFTCSPCYTGDCVEFSICCASYIWVEAGECDWCETSLPVIVDCEAPWASLELCMDDCDCAGCELSFATASCSYTCDPDEELCGDSHYGECPGCDDVYDCSGLASWSLAIYEDDPFEECCEVPCEEPIYECSGTECPIACVTDCLSEFAGVQTGYTTECVEECVPYETEGCLDWTQCYCACEEGTAGAIDDPDNPGEYICPCECEIPICCEYGIVDSGETCTIICEDTPIYDCNWLFVVLTMVDNVGNDAMYGAWIASSDYPDCDNVCIEEVTDHSCLDDACGVFVNAPYDCDCDNVDCTCVVEEVD